MTIRMLARIKKHIKKIIPSSEYLSLNTIEIKQSHIQHNFKIIQEIQPTHIIIPVVKSNAYGHGLKQIAKILSRINNISVPLIAVDSYPEYQILSDNTDKQILVLWETLSWNYRLYNSHRTHIAVGSLQVLQSLITTEKKRNIHIFLNTGMNREWFQEKELKKALNLLSHHKNITVMGVMSHLANADLEDNTFTQQQISQFKKMYKYIQSYEHKPLYIHIANSAGLVKINDPLFTASRTGLALYGYNPLQEKDSFYGTYTDLKPALRLISTVTALQRLTAGEGVNYGLDRKTNTTTTLATLPIWYNEWIPRWAWIWYVVYKDNLSFSLRGKVCMNLCSIQVGEIDIDIGDSIEIIGRDMNKKNTIQQLCKINDSISYVSLTNLDPFMKRIIV